jgi:hypothetical protein
VPDGLSLSVPVQESHVQDKNRNGFLRVAGQVNDSQFVLATGKDLDIQAIFEDDVMVQPTTLENLVGSQGDSEAEIVGDLEKEEAEDYIELLPYRQRRELTKKIPTEDVTKVLNWVSSSSFSFGLNHWLQLLKTSLLYLP